MKKDCQALKSETNDISTVKKMITKFEVGFRAGFYCFLAKTK